MRFFSGQVLVSFVEPIPGKSIEVYQLAVLGGPLVPLLLRRESQKRVTTHVTLVTESGAVAVS